MEDLRKRAIEIVQGNTTWYMLCAKCKTSIGGTASFKIDHAKFIEVTKPGLPYFADNYFETYEIAVPKELACHCKSEAFQLWVLPEVQILSVLDHKELATGRFPINAKTKQVYGTMRNNNREKDFGVRILLGLVILEGNPDKGVKLTDKVIQIASSEQIEIHRSEENVRWVLTFDKEIRDDICAVLLELPAVEEIKKDQGTAKFLGVNPHGS